MRLASAAPFALLAVAACSSPKAPPLAPLGTVREVPVSYRAELAPKRAGPAAKEREDAGKAAPGSKASAGGPAIELACRFLAFAPAEERALFDSRAGSSFGAVFPLADLESACASCARNDGLESICAPKLTLNDDAHGRISVLDHVSYVSSFTFERARGAVVADPTVEQLPVGLSLDTTSRLVDGGAKIAVTLDVQRTDLMRPVRDVVTRFPGIPTDVTLQLPVCFEQHLSAHSELAPDEVLVLGGLVDEHGRSCFVCVSAKRATTDDAGGAPADHGLHAKR